SLPMPTAWAPWPGQRMYVGDAIHVAWATSPCFAFEKGHGLVAHATVDQTRTTALAQVRPAPNATKTRTSPASILPARQASSNAIGTDAAEVLPYLSMLTNAFSGGSPSFSIAESMIRWFTWCGTI